jgi:hypothetical protein
MRPDESSESFPPNSIYSGNGFAWRDVPSYGMKFSLRACKGSMTRRPINETDVVPTPI